jgi:hypothetical protein
MHGSMHVSGTHSWKNQGVGGGVLVFEGGVIAPPCQGVGSTLPPCELARSRRAERPSYRPIRRKLGAISHPFPAKRGASPCRL